MPTSNKKIQGEYDKVCKLTSVFDIMKLASIIKINFDEAKLLIEKACKFFNVIPPKIIQTQGKQEYNQGFKIFLRQPTTISATLHELAHYLTFEEIEKPQKIISKKLLKLYFGVDSINKLSEQEKKML